MIFDEDQAIPLAKLVPGKTIGISAMHPAEHYLKEQANVSVNGNNLLVGSDARTETSIWFGGFNPFATYTVDLDKCSGRGAIGFEFSDAGKKERLWVKVVFEEQVVSDVKLLVMRDNRLLNSQSIYIKNEEKPSLKGRIILQMLGSGLVVYLQEQSLPLVIAQADFPQDFDLRAKERISAFQTRLYVEVERGRAAFNEVAMVLSTGIGQADIRPITYENGDLFLDRGRIWYTMSVRGRALPHHVQGVFSMDPTVFDLKLEGYILFDRNDGLLRNEIASHIFYDRKSKLWRGLTTGFSAYANPGKEKKQLLAVESRKDPRFGFSIMKAAPFGVVGDIEDPHILFDEKAGKWRILTCENYEGYKAVILESDIWNKGYKKIYGPVEHNSTGTSMQRIDGKLFCFSGSSEGKIFIYSYPDLEEAGTLKMDLPPWDLSSNTRVWPNVVELPEGYPFRFVALMMDRFNYPGMKGPNWTYGALYLYHGH